MHIIKYTWQHRYDFDAIIECKHCGHQQELNSGYDDDNYHRNVLPKIPCAHCGKNEYGVIGENVVFGYPKVALLNDSSDVHTAIEEAACIVDEMSYLGPDFVECASKIRELKRKYE